MAYCLQWKRFIVCQLSYEKFLRYSRLYSLDRLDSSDHIDWEYFCMWSPQRVKLYSSIIQFRHCTLQRHSPPRNLLRCRLLFSIRLHSQILDRLWTFSPEFPHPERRRLIYNYAPSLFCCLQTIALHEYLILWYRKHCQHQQFQLGLCQSLCNKSPWIRYHCIDNR